MILSLESPASSIAVVFFHSRDLEKFVNLAQIIDINDNLNELWLQYSVEPHVRLKVNLKWPLGFHPDMPTSIERTSLTHEAVSRWPPEVLNSITNVRGGFCCVKVTAFSIPHAVVPILQWVDCGVVVRLKMSYILYVEFCTISIAFG